MARKDEGPHIKKFQDDMPLGMMLNMVAHCHDNIIREELDAIGAPKAFGGILMHLSHHEGVKQSEIANKMNFSPPTVSVTVQKLEEGGYIERVPDEKDQRQFRIYLTDKGREMTGKISDTFSKCESVLAKGFTDQESVLIRFLLKKMYTNLSEEKKI